jgi:hypothetical protein
LQKPLLVAAFVLLLVPVANATPAIPDPLSTVNCWDTWENWTIGSASIQSDYFAANPANPAVGPGQLFGNPASIVTDGNVANGFFNFATSTTAGSLVDPQVIVKLLNYPNNNPVKHIEVYARFVAQRYIAKVETTGFDANGQVQSITGFDAPAPIVEGNFFVQKFEYDIRPNPYTEQIVFTLGGQCFWELDKLCIATTCIPTPIPGSLVLLGSGILGMVGIGIRRKSA